MRMSFSVIAVVLPLALAGCGDSKAAGTGGGEQAAGKAAAAEGAQAAPTAVVHELPGDPEAGKQVYAKICIACHAADGRGNGGITGADFVKEKDRLAKSNDELYKSVAEGMTTGKVPMPPQLGILTEQEINDALAYVRATFGGS